MPGGPPLTHEFLVVKPSTSAPSCALILKKAFSHLTSPHHQRFCPGSPVITCFFFPEVPTLTHQDRDQNTSGFPLCAPGTKSWLAVRPPCCTSPENRSHWGRGTSGQQLGVAMCSNPRLLLTPPPASPAAHPGEQRTIGVGA